MHITFEYVHVHTNSATACVGETVRFLLRIYELVNERGESVGHADTRDLKPYLENAASE